MLKNVLFCIQELLARVLPAYKATLPQRDYCDYMNAFKLIQKNLKVTTDKQGQSPIISMLVKVLSFYFHNKLMKQPISLSSKNIFISYEINN
jgi:hypothetical protein